VKVGHDASVIVTVSGSDALKPTGTVTVKNGSVEIGSGELVDGTVTVTAETSSLAAGTYHLTLVYGGDDTYAGDTGEVVLTVAKAVPTVSVSPAGQVYGRTAAVEVKVTGPKTPTGTVTLRYGATVLGTGTLSGAKVTITVPAGVLAPGTYTLTATYTGDGNNEGGQSGAGQLSVTPAPASAVSVVAPAIPAGAGRAVTVRISVSGLPVTGTVKVRVGKRTVTVHAVNGVAKLKPAQIRKLLGKRKHVRVTMSGTGFSTKFTLKLRKRHARR
jgi:hypothetical protein